MTSARHRPAPFTRTPLLLRLGAITLLLALPACAPPPDDHVEAVSASATAAPAEVVRRIDPDPDRTITSVVSEDRLSGDGYVRVPGNQLAHSSCFYNVPDDAAVDVDETGRSFVTSAAGERTPIAPCSHSAVSPQAAVSPAAASAKTYHGWIESSWYGPQALPTKVHATWTVPPAPSRQSGQTIFFFPAVEGVKWTPIVQPELLFTSGAWWIRSEYGPDQNGNYYTSPAKRVNPGDLVSGTIQAISCTAAGLCTWRITSQVAAKRLSSVLNVGRLKALIQVFGSALEVYGISRCDELPGGNPYIWFNDLGVWSYTAKLAPSWTPEYYDISPLKCRQLVNTKSSDKISMYFR